MFQSRHSSSLLFAQNPLELAIKLASKFLEDMKKGLQDIFSSTQNLNQVRTATNFSACVSVILTVDLTEPKFTWHPTNSRPVENSCV